MTTNNPRCPWEHLSSSLTSAWRESLGERQAVLPETRLSDARQVPRGLAPKAAAPMVFEFPFDLIVMARTYPPIPPDPAMYRVLFFAPLFLVEFATLSFLTFAPMARLTRATVFSFALMLAVFAAWALSGFAFPGTPGPFAFNVLSKILAFTTALTLFLPQRSEASTSPPAAVPEPGASQPAQLPERVA